jgi:predicted enzyme related to lactoylglutathione lyase
MSATPSKFVWYDVMTTDMKVAEAFYRKAIGWETKDSGMPGHAYTLLSAGTTMVGGMMPIPEEAARNGATPVWSGYIAVDDVDAYAGKVKAAGGTIHRPPADIPEVGRFAVAADPQGATFILFQPNSAEGPAPVPPGTPGHIGWHELHAGDGGKAFDFYEKLFGWTKTDALDMGPMGVYQLFATGGDAVGGMMTKMPQEPRPFWLYYFQVDKVDAAVDRIKRGGGKILNGPMEVPGGQWIAQATDPQGALFAIVGKTR